jgi:methylmalonyl-CoA carboxyltransferase large subunit
VAEELTELIQAVSERQLAAEGRLSELAAAFKALEARVAELSQPEGASVAEAATPAPAAKEAVNRKNEEVTPEMLVVIAAAVTAFLGKKVRIRSAKMLRPAFEGANPWSLQGRVSVHASHHLRFRG